MYGYSFYSGKKFKGLVPKLKRKIISVKSFEEFLTKLQKDATENNAKFKLFETYVYILMMYELGCRTSDALEMKYKNI